MLTSQPQKRTLTIDMSNKAVYLITADDDFIAANRAREIFEELSANALDDMSKEIINGTAGKVEESLEACRRVKEACATLPLFGGLKTVWFRGVNFINDTRQGKSEDLKNALEDLAEFLKSLDPEKVALVINASPVDRRKKVLKDIAKFAEYEDFQSKDPTSACVDILEREAKKLGVRFGEDALETLAATVAGNPRMAIQELNKLAAYINFNGEITAKDVSDMVPIFGEGDFFDISNAFYSGNLESALAALRRHFFANKNASARPIIATLQKQNSILIQLRALMEAGVLRKTQSPQPRGAIDAAAEQYLEYFGGSKEKSNYNIFSQNAWYAGSKLAPIAARIPLKRLLDMQMNIIWAFEELLARPNSDESVMRDLFVRSI